MVHKNFRSYQLAIQFYRQCDTLRCPAHLKSQLLRAASSVVLNLAEGSGKASDQDRRRFYGIALGSVREVQAVMDLTLSAPQEMVQLSDSLGACVYRLCHPVR